MRNLRKCPTVIKSTNLLFVFTLLMTLMAGKLVSTTWSVDSSTTQHTQPEQQQKERTPVKQDKSPAQKRKPPSTPSTANCFEVITAGAGREVSVLFSEFAEVLSERTAADSSQMGELEDILREAKSLESSLREKKQHLRDTLAVISDKLKG